VETDVCEDLVPIDDLEPPMLKEIFESFKQGPGRSLDETLKISDCFSEIERLKDRVEDLEKKTKRCKPLYLKNGIWRF
jgi:hypothetical protein